jgi:gamma-glutamyltranspeptidase
MYGLIQGEGNSIAPGKAPLSAMTPTIVVKNGKPLFALGSPGGPTIINTVLQILVNLIDFGMNLQEAVSAPRIHHQWMPDAIAFEPFGLSADTRAELEKQEQSTCREAVTGLKLDRGAVVRADVYVLSAIVELSNGQAAFLDQGQEGWRIAAVGCKPSAKPADRPFDCELED